MRDVQHYGVPLKPTREWTKTQTMTPFIQLYNARYVEHCPTAEPIHYLTEKGQVRGNRMKYRIDVTEDVKLNIDQFRTPTPHSDQRGSELLSFPTGSI